MESEEALRSTTTLKFMYIRIDTACGVKFGSLISKAFLPALMFFDILQFVSIFKSYKEISFLYVLTSFGIFLYGVRLRYDMKQGGMDITHMDIFIGAACVYKNTKGLFLVKGLDWKRFQDTSIVGKIVK